MTDEIRKAAEEYVAEIGYCQQDIERFLGKLDNKSRFSCWNWTGSKHRFGYGEISVIKDGKKVRLKTHRLSWEIYRGVIPSGMCVLHKCDNPACCNPLHLYIGTRLDNVADMILRDRKACTLGEKASKARLTKKQVNEIAKSDKKQDALAEEYKVSREAISHIQNGITWSSVTGIKPSPKGKPKILRGESHPNAKLSKSEMLNIKSSKESTSVLAARYNVGVTAIKDIRSGRSWV